MNSPRFHYSVETILSLTGKDIRTLYNESSNHSEGQSLVRPNGLLDKIVHKFRVRHNLCHSSICRLFDTTDYDDLEIEGVFNLEQLKMLYKITNNEVFYNLIKQNEQQERLINNYDKLNEMAEKQSCKRNCKEKRIDKRANC